ncbi:hypothetical protein [Ligilactobacillus animalis]|uniref:hypothetical protein n=1 Tax=Ligilactobacillus animalis TaxID=1605 RepID=UPI00021951B9|nr:hypothetical protein [Ligilactobacillus animalis]
MNDKILTINGAAKLLGVRRSVIEELLEDPKLPRLFVGTSQQVRLVQSQLITYIRERGINWYDYVV